MRAGGDLVWVDPLVLPEVVRDPFIGAWAHHRSGGARNNMGSHLEGGASASHGPGDGGSTSTRHELPELVSRVASGGGGGRAEIQGLASFTHTIPNLGSSVSVREHTVQAISMTEATYLQAH
ncbi:hypothetical protein BDA96_07G141100 [Sorghum bicolor]|uniref:Uncharacterized protein n=2 Tax=Sorghum bicolor TaxID=4558 RepID=A0A921QN84_SORBI|nr:hypothetical protein BDA96_07G141100 [Sorghum bicolor]KXG28306.1 hypothetical protein SORBI_3005G108000 [Sorghum bicolor]